MPLEIIEPNYCRPWDNLKADLLVVLHRIVIKQKNLAVYCDGDSIGILHIRDKRQVVAVGHNLRSGVFVTNCRFKPCLFMNTEFHAIVHCIHECVLFYSLPRWKYVAMKARQRFHKVMHKMRFWSHNV